MCYRSELRSENIKKPPPRAFARKPEPHLAIPIKGLGEGLGQAAALKSMRGQNLGCSGLAFHDIEKATCPRLQAPMASSYALNGLSLISIFLPCNDFLPDLGLPQRIRSKHACPTHLTGCW